jgi:single-strand DNA-binding protein
MNKLIVSGGLTRDAEVTYLASGTAALRFSLANTTGFGDKKQTNYFNCVAFGKIAEGKLPEFLKKGSQILTEGEVTLNTYQKNDGTTGASLQLLVSNIELIGGNRSQDQGGQQQAQQSRPQQQRPSQNRQKQAQTYDEFEDSDIPF